MAVAFLQPTLRDELVSCSNIMKKLIILFITAGIMISSCGPSRKLQTTSRAPNVALELINIGAYSNDPSADRARTAFDKANGPIREYNRLQLYYLEPTELAILRGATVTTAELNRLSGVTSAIQTQINGRIRSVDSTGTAPGNYVTRKALVDTVTNRTTAIVNSMDIPTNYQPDSAVVVSSEVHFFAGADTLYNPPPYDMRDDAATLFPTIQSAAGDTSNYTVPDKIGDLYIDTSTGDAYYSSTSARNGWRSMGDRTTINTGTVVDATGITTAMFSRFIYYSEAAATNITADPQIANGYAGQLITIIGSSDTNTLTLDDDAGLRLTGQMVLGIGDNITLLYENTIGDWIEISRSNN